MSNTLCSLRSLGALPHSRSCASLLIGALVLCAPGVLRVGHACQLVRSWAVRLCALPSRFWSVAPLSLPCCPGRAVDRASVSHGNGVGWSGCLLSLSAHCALRSALALRLMLARLPRAVCASAQWLALVAADLLNTLLLTCVGRCSDYALQRADGSYLRVGHPLTAAVLAAHVRGQQTIGSYVMNEDGACHFAVFDADSMTAFLHLLAVQDTLRQAGIPSYVESSRRGGHLWVFLASWVAASVLRQWLLPFCPADVEFYPKQDTAVYGSLMRVPLGVHQRSGRVYPFVALDAAGQLRAVAPSVKGQLHWLATVERAAPQLVTSGDPAHTPTNHTLQKRPGRIAVPTPSYPSIGDWCRAHDPLDFIGRTVDLDRRGMGCCPFGWHHAAGVDRHPSLWVYRPTGNHLACWYCHTWGRGGSLFDFVRLYYGLDARTLWARIQTGETF